MSPQTLTVTPVLTTKTLPLVLKAAATPALPASVLSPRPPTVAMVTTSITKPDSQNVPINLQVASKLTNQSSEPVRLLSKNAMVVSPPPLACPPGSGCAQCVCRAEGPVEFGSSPGGVTELAKNTPVVEGGFLWCC